jgi:hypothetical protein
MNLPIIPLLIAILGLILWFLVAHPKVAEAGKILFFCATLVLLMALASVKHI